MQGIKLVTFDATNTVLKFRIPPWQFYSLVAKDHGYNVKEDVLKTQMKESFKLMNTQYPNFGRGSINWEKWWHEVVKLTFNGQLPDEVDVGLISKKLINEFKTAKCWVVAKESEKLLGDLKNIGVTTGVISNFDPRLCDILHNVGLHKYFDFILTSYDVGYSKPDPRIFELAIVACKKQIKAAECLHVGDDLEKDYEGARGAGWHALLVGSENWGKLSARGHLFASIQDLRNAIELNKLIL